MSVTRLCTCILIRRVDGVEMGFTDHDDALTVEGVTYDPHGGFDASSLESRIGIAVDSVDATGYISDARITEQDVFDGRYARAKVILTLVDWRSAEVVQRFPTFEIADTQVGRILIEVTLELSVALQWQRTGGEIITGNCPHILGDAKCAAAVPSVAATVTAADAARLWIETTAGGAAPAGLWRGGLIRFGGMDYEISHTVGARLFVYSALPAIESGDAVTLLLGCDKSFEMCGAFNNQNRFGGFPHMPGEDANFEVIRRGDGKDKSGGSIFS